MTCLFISKNVFKYVCLKDLNIMAVPYEMLLYPELLPNEKLIQIIQERRLRIENLANLSRTELLELFHNFCVPFGQRKHRGSGRGKILNKDRQTKPEKTKTANGCDRKIDNKPACSMSVALDNNKKRTLCHSNEDFPKPDTDVLSGQVKKIKIDRSNLNKSTVKRKPSDPVNIASSCLPLKKERKPITWP